MDLSRSRLKLQGMLVNAQQTSLLLTLTRSIARQLLRHRSFTFQEFSQRYSQVAEEPFIFQARAQDDNNRQNSLDIMDGLTKDWFERAQVQLWDYSQNLYKMALTKNIAKEQARCLLPEGLTHSTLYMSGNVRSWIHFCQLRSTNGSQREIMDVAKQCIEQLTTICPTIFSILFQQDE